MDNLNLDKAEGIFAISNTPAFLLRKLSEDEVTNYVGKKYSGDEILSKLKNVIESDKTDTKSSVLPFIFLVALWKKDDISYLEKAAILSTSDDWFKFRANILLQTYKSTSIKEIKITAIPNNLIIPHSTYAIDRKLVILDNR
jgi:hypothetical protein